MARVGMTKYDVKMAKLLQGLRLAAPGIVTSRLIRADLKLKHDAVRSYIRKLRSQGYIILTYTKLGYSLQFDGGLNVEQNLLVAPNGITKTGNSTGNVLEGVADGSCKP